MAGRVNPDDTDKKIIIPDYVYNFINMSFADKEAWFDKKGFSNLSHAPIAKQLFCLLCQVIIESEQSKAGPFITGIDFYNYVLARRNNTYTPNFPKTLESLRPYMVEFLENMKRHGYCDWTFLKDKFNIKIRMLDEPPGRIKSVAVEKLPENFIDKIDKALQREWDHAVENKITPFTDFPHLSKTLQQNTENIISYLGARLQRMESSEFNRDLREHAGAKSKNHILLYFLMPVKDPKTGETMKLQLCEPVMFAGTRLADLFSIIKSRADFYIHQFISDGKMSFNLSIINDHLNNLYPSSGLNLNAMVETQGSDTLQYSEVWAAIYEIIIKQVLSRYNSSPWQVCGLQTALLMYSWFTYNVSQEMIKIERAQLKNNIRAILETGKGIISLQELTACCEDYINKYGMDNFTEILSGLTGAYENKPGIKEKKTDKPEELLQTIICFRHEKKDEYYIYYKYLMPLFIGKLREAKSRNPDKPGFLLKYIIHPWKELLSLNMNTSGNIMNLHKIRDMLKDNRSLVDYAKSQLPKIYPLLADIYNYFEKNPGLLKQLCLLLHYNVNEFLKDDGTVLPLWFLTGIQRSEVIQELYRGRGLYHLWKLFNSWLHNLFNRNAERCLMDVVVEEERTLFHKRSVQPPDQETKNPEDYQAHQPGIKKRKQEEASRFNDNYKQLCDTYVKGKRASDIKELQQAYLKEWNIRPVIKNPQERKFQEEKDKFDIDEEILRYLSILKSDLSKDTFFEVVYTIIKNPPAINVTRQEALKQYIIVSFLLYLRTE